MTMPSPADTFATITGSLDYPMLVITAMAEGERAGCLVGFSTQCSIDPPRFLVCLSDKNRTFRVAERATALAVHVLGPESLEVARLFGSETGDEDDKFARCRWEEGPRGLPILQDCHRWFAGKIVERWVLGDHAGYVLEPFAAHAGRTEGLLTFSQVKHLDPGHEA
jgi:flavin reductase (DIM6/NTAB) family NADH-FMN oxidoreductase RutF